MIKRDEDKATEMFLDWFKKEGNKLFSFNSAEYLQALKVFKIGFMSGKVDKRKKSEK